MGGGLRTNSDFDRFDESALKRTRLIAFAATVFLFAYGLINYRLIVSRIIYRFVAGDIAGALTNFLSFAFQGLLLLFVLAVLPHRAIVIVLLLVSLSAVINVTYSQFFTKSIELSDFSWLLVESRQVGSAIQEFWPVFATAFARVALAISLFYWVSYSLRRAYVFSDAGRGAHRFRWIASLMLFLLLEPLLGHVLRFRDVTLNAYGLLVRNFASTYPERSPVLVKPVAETKVQKILWLIDESVNSTGFQSILRPELVSRPDTTIFDDVISMANCSAQSNATLRWGVNVLTVSRTSDLRKTPTIWAYAKAAGYRTSLIDGQVNGAPQNMVWPPERKLIDEYIPALAGIDTDRHIASRINRLLRVNGKEFVIVVLRGAHYQYESNYPSDEAPEHPTIEARYLKAIEYSKRLFFRTAFDGTDSSSYAVFYTSDHGQVLKAGRVPHCNEDPHEDEFLVPLSLSLRPLDARSILGPMLSGRRSHSQIFPTSLYLMGYESEYAERSYDNTLEKPSRKLVKFGRTVYPSNENGEIEVSAVE